MTDSKFILISSGGTGGHMSPAAALADELVQRGHRVELMTDPRGMRYTKMFPGITVHEVKAGTAGAGVMGKVKGLINLVLGIKQAAQFMRKNRPDIVVGFGGYPSVPGVLGAQLSKIPTALHEQNAIIGKANMFLLPKAKAFGLSLPLVTKLENVEHVKIKLTGNPVRKEIVAMKGNTYTPMSADGEMNILIMGGSLGATILSQVVPEALSKLSREYRQRLNIVQQCREADLEEVRAAYDNAKIKAQLCTFIDDVVSAYEQAHLFIGRSGASTVAEIAIAGLPAIYVPLNVHKDQQQKRNANVIADEGGAWVMTEEAFTPETLMTRIETFFQNPQSLPRAAERAKTCAKSDAAQALADLVLDAAV